MLCPYFLDPNTKRKRNSRLVFNLERKIKRFFPKNFYPSKFQFCFSVVCSVMRTLNLMFIFGLIFNFENYLFTLFFSAVYNKIMFTLAFTNLKVKFFFVPSSKHNYIDWKANYREIPLDFSLFNILFYRSGEKDNKQTTIENKIFNFSSTTFLI